MKIVFSQHASLQIKQRNLPKDLVVRAVKESDMNSPSYGFREERYKKFGKLYMKVVVQEEIDKVLVITAHWVAKPKSKWYYQL